MEISAGAIEINVANHIPSPTWYGRRAKSPAPQTPRRLSKTRLAEMVEEATVDAYGESEQATGWFTMIEQNLHLPFETQVLGTAVTVTKITPGNDDRISAICTRGRDRPGDLNR